MLPLAEGGLQLGERITYSGFRAIFIAAWLLVVGALACIAGGVQLGFVLLVGAGVAFAALGTMLALNSGELSDRMVKQVQSGQGDAGGALTMSRFGGTVLLVIGGGMAIVGIVEVAI